MRWIPCPNGSGWWRAVCSALLGLVVLGMGCTEEYRRNRDLQSKDPAVRARAVRRIAKDHPKGAVTTLIGLLEDRAVRVRVEAANGLGKLKAKSAASPLGAALRDPDPRVRLAVVRALARLGRDLSADHLLTAAQDPNRRVRRVARFLLQDLGVDRPEQMRRIVARRVFKHRRMLVNRLPARRQEAAKMLGRSGRLDVVADLEHLVGDAYVKVAEEAATALGMIGGARAVTFLDQVSSRSKHGRQLARRGFLGLLEGRAPQGADLARRLLGSGDGELRAAALSYLLAKIPGVEPTAGDVLCRVLDDPDPRRAVRWANVLRQAKVRCPARMRTPAATRLAAMTQAAPLDPAVITWIRAELFGAGPPHATAVALAATRGDKRLRGKLLSRVQSDYAKLLLSSERWLDEKQWKRLEKLPTVKGVAVRRTDPGSLTGGGPPLGAQKQRLKRLLDRFPERQASVGELMPSGVNTDTVVWQLRWLETVGVAHTWLAGLVRKSPRLVRLAALEVLGRAQCEVAVCRSALALASVDGEAVVRTAAVHALGRSRSVDAKRLNLLLGDPSVQVRAAAALALARTQGERVYPELLKRFRQSRQSYLIEAFAVLADPRAEKVLLAVLREEHSRLRVGQRLAVLEGLEKLATKAAVDKLVSELEHPEPALRLAAARILARVGDRRALDPLAACAEDFYRVVRRSCIAARAAIQKRR
jgi:HEAT repeat protein